MRNLVLLLVLLLSPCFAEAQTVNDLTQLYLSQNKIAWSSGDWSTCQPDGKEDGICTWNTVKLGVQPTTTQLQIYTSVWQNMQQALACPQKVSEGAAITSTSASALNGTYSVDQKSITNINATATSIANGLGLPGGGTSFQYADQSGAFHSFTASQFLNFAVGMRDYSYNLQVACINAAKGQTVTWPSASVTIP